MSSQQVPNWSEQAEILRRHTEALLRQRMRPLQPTCIAEDIVCGDRLMTPTTARLLPWLPRSNVAADGGQKPISAQTILVWFDLGLEYVKVPERHRWGHDRRWTTAGAIKRFLGIKIPSVTASSLPMDPAEREAIRLLTEAGPNPATGKIRGRGKRFRGGATAP